MKIKTNYIYSRNKDVEIKFSAHDTILEEPSSGTLKAKPSESHILMYLRARQLKGPRRMAKIY
jgi:hypothetical protein